MLLCRDRVIGIVRPPKESEIQMKSFCTVGTLFAIASLISVGGCIMKTETSDGTAQPSPTVERVDSAIPSAVDEKASKIAAARANAVALIERVGGKYEQDPNSLDNPISKLHLNGSKINDSSLLQLRDLNKVKFLDLNGCVEIGDAGLVAVEGMGELEILTLWGCHKITDKGFESLKNLSSLRTLNIGLTGIENVTGSGLVHLKGLTSLRDLTLNILRVLDERNLEYLTGLTNLETLGLRACNKVGDAGMDYVAKLRQLQYLDLAETQVTDAGLQKLRGLSSLKEIRLGNTKVTDAGVADLKAAIPNLSVIRE